MQQRGELKDAKVVKTLKICGDDFFKDPLANHERAQTQGLESIKSVFELGPDDK